MVNKWVVKGVKKHIHERKDDFDPKSVYTWTVSSAGCAWMVSSSFHFSDVQLLMKHFDVKLVSELREKVFESPGEYKETGNALNYFLHVIKNGGDYNPPPIKEVANKAVSLLSEMKCPDFSDVDEQTIHNAFHWLFSKTKLDRVWFETFKEKIHKVSSGRVSIEEADAEEFPIQYHGTAAYLRLVSREQIIKFIFRPCATPFLFCE